MAFTPYTQEQKKGQSEMRRWLDNDHESSLHQRINNRGLMYSTHLLKLSSFDKNDSKALMKILKVIPSRLEKGKFKHFVNSLGLGKMGSTGKPLGKRTLKALKNEK